jgi:hypothetical protein
MTETVLYNTRIHTQSQEIPLAEAIAIRDARIVAVGTLSEMEAAVPKATRLNLEGRAVVPGLIDAHMHMEWYSVALTQVEAGTATLAECLKNVAAQVQRTPRGAWVTGGGWNQTNWGGQFPTAQQLDSISTEHPIYLRAQSGHAGWANSLALKLANITAHTPHPPGGEIQKDADGQPTGILLEEAMGLVGRLITPPSEAELAEMMLTAQVQLWRYGLTGVHDFDGRRSLAAWQILRERGHLGLRVCKTIRVAYLEHAIALGLRSGFGDEWLRLGNVKVFLDGALGPRTARMIEPYADGPNNYGITVTDTEEFYEQASRAALFGLAMTTHAIGDKANHDLLNVYARVREEEAGRGPVRLRQRCEHVQILHPQDYARLGQLNVIASMQPIHATSDMEMAERGWGARSAGAYAWRTQLNAGATLAFGSDAPVESPNPLLGIHAAVTRRRTDGTPGPDGWYPDQRLTVAEAVRGFTHGAAYAGYMEKDLGALTPGKLADLVVLDQDIFTCEPMAIQDTQAVGTMVGGEWKYRAF